MSDYEKLNKKVDKALKQMNECFDKPYLIPKKDLEEIIKNSIGSVFHEEKKINLLVALLVIGIIDLMMMGFIIWTLFFTVPLQ